LKKVLIAIIYFFFSHCYAQNYDLNAPDRLDIMAWNTEWLGDANNGPSNEPIQMSNVIKVIKNYNSDVVGLCEVSSDQAWKDLQSNLPDYKGVRSTWTQTQKTALLFKKDQFELVYQKHVLDKYDYDFASGRLPLEVCLKTPGNDTFYFWVIHLKANTGSTSDKVEAYNRRYTAALALKTHTKSFKNGVILGDWNDDFDQSILTGYYSPFLGFVKDTASFVSATLKLSSLGKKSTVSYSEMIDHIVLSSDFKGGLIEDSIMVLNPSSFISSYGSSTSDHYPVFVKTKFPVKRNAGINELTEIQYYFDVDGKLVVNGNAYEKVFVYDMLGRLRVFENNVYFSDLNRGLNVVYIDNKRIRLKIVK
jgi:endonuclease/exonuclease/phosphatase family metal-dependent hydrolase